MQDKLLDVLIVGAGISGIGTACHLADECPDKTFAILDRRKNIGGTWDLFRYPGIRSDSDVFTMGFGFKPWTRDEVLADGSSIREYLQEAAEEYDVYNKIRFGLKVSAADWSSDENCWKVTALNEESGELETYRSKFLVMGTGYYNYDEGYTPDLPGMEKFKGQIIHPQKWPEDLDYTGKKVIVIGSGATAVTLVPAMAGTASHITMLQRSPSYIFSLPEEDKVSSILRKFLPDDTVYDFARWRHIKLYQAIWKSSKRWPGMMRRLILGLVKRQVGADQMHHFSPDYKPWDERLCAVPGNDLFKAMNRGKASVVTDHIETFTAEGIKLKSGKTLEADIIITATGLQLQMLGGTDLQVDGESKDFSELMMYKAVLIQDVPNFAWIMGYVNYPWTLKADIASKYICRLIRHMDAKGYAAAVPVDQQNSAIDSPFMDALDSGYINRYAHKMPRQGNAEPWEVTNNYTSDQKLLLEDDMEDGVLRFESEDTGSQAAGSSRQAA